MENDWQLARPLAGVALLVAGGYALRAMVRELVVGEIERTGSPLWLFPEFGSVGQTVLVYLLFTSLVSYVAIPFLAFALGYRSGEGATR